MSLPTTRFILRIDPWRDAIGIAIISGDGESSYIAEPLTLAKIAPGEELRPTTNIRPDDAQDLFNQLWANGFRPKDGTGNTGHIEALKYHLEDMRSLVFKRSKTGRV